MTRSVKIVQFVNSALEGIKSIGRRLLEDKPISELEKDVWSVYKDCESAVFLIKLEISDIEAPDDTAQDNNFDRPDYAIFLAEDHLKNTLAAIEKKEMHKALEQARVARNVMEEIYSQVKKENLKTFRERKKAKDLIGIHM
ncbi:MAG: hypothetical protein ACUVQ8_01905 [Nitrososphaeria archaeon]